MRARRFLEDVGEAVAGELHLLAGPFSARAVEAVLPFDVVPGVDTDFEAFVARPAHDVGRGPTDVGPGEQRAVEQRRDAVVANDGCALHLLEKPRPKNAPDRPARVIGAHAEQECCPGTVSAQDVEQARHTLTGSTQRIDVDLEGEEHG